VSQLANTFDDDEYFPAFTAWKADPTPQGNATYLQQIKPIVDKGVKLYGGSSPISASKGKLLALSASQNFDPKKAKLQSHLLNQMKGLQRMAEQQEQVLKVPERILLQRNLINNSMQELQDELGREPTDLELSDHTHLPFARLAQVRSYQPGTTDGHLSTLDPENSGTGSLLPGDEDAQKNWLQIVHGDLSPMDQRILEMTLGMNGQKKHSNLEIAAKLSRSPGAITQRKAKIQTLLDQEQQFSPFL
jgi:DNA-directed RNA polymerase specialized sigma subunit